MRTTRIALLTPILVLALLLVASDSFAQRGGSGAPPMQPNTPFEDFVEALRLDNRSQVPQVQQLMVEGAKGSAGLVTEIFQARQLILNLELTNKAAEKPPALQSHAALAAQMAGAEAATFAKVYALLRPNQQSRAPGAFAQMAGFFFPPANPGRAGRGSSGGALGRMDILANLFTLDGDQKREIRGWLDAAHKSAADARKGLSATRTALVAAIQAGADQAAIDAATAAYAVQVTIMADGEMTMLARIIQRLTPEQRGNQQAISTAFALMRGFFVNDRRWDIVPDGRAY